MKKIPLLVIFLVVLAPITNAQVAWVTQKIDNNLTIKFPDKANKTTKDGHDIFTYIGKDSVKYSTAMVDYKVIANLDSAGLAPIKDTQRFADAVKGGIASKKTDYTFGEIIISKWKAYTAYRISGSDNISKNKLSIQMILIDTKMYILSCLVPAELDTKNNEEFFSSAELSKI